MWSLPRKALLPKKWNENEILRDGFDGVLFLFAMLVVAFRIEVVGCLIFLGITGAALVLSDRLSDSFVPLILMTVFVTRCYDSFDVFIRYIPLYVVVILCALFHFVYYFAKPKIGASFPGLVAVTAALMLGGIGSLSAAAYFRPLNLYYVLGLGILMILLYLFAQPRADDAARDRFLRALFLAGCLAAYAVLIFYARGWSSFRQTYRAINFQSSNNLATFLMISLPIGFLYSKQNRALIFVPALQYVALLFCDSRGGTYLGTAEFFFLLLFFCFYRSDWFRRAFFIGFFLLTVTVFICFLPKVLTFYYFDLKIDHFADLTIPQLIKATVRKLIDNGEARVGLLGRSLADFKSNPVFGVGLGYTGNEDLYSPVKGAMNWYHMWLPQIWGSLGIVGLLCFGYQLFLRAKLAFTRREFPEVTLSLCYFGLLLMSQVNPGEFCPIPYAVIATTIFLFLDRKEPNGKKTEQSET
ncbi:MAG: O-antigen ligase family protein [Clostridia bacterium]|nr:O-antigen ligase family protein [Clostridia bacterium]